MAMQLKTMIAELTEFSVFDGNIVLLFNCDVKLFSPLGKLAGRAIYFFVFFVLTKLNVVANNPRLIIQQYAKPNIANIFIAIISTLIVFDESLTPIFTIFYIMVGN